MIWHRGHIAWVSSLSELLQTEEAIEEDHWGGNIEEDDPRSHRGGVKINPLRGHDDSDGQGGGAGNKLV